VGESGRITGSIKGSSQKATRFFGLGGLILPLNAFPSMELRDGTGEDILVEAIDPEVFEPEEECKLDKDSGSRDDERLMS
jgi:hypothetical protein